MIELCLAVDQCVSWPDSATVGRSTAGRSTATATTTLLADWSPDIDIDIDAWMRWRSQQFRVCMQNRQSTIAVAAVTLHNISRAVDWACKSPLLVACLSWLWVLFPIAVEDFHSFITNLIELPLLLLLPGGTRSPPSLSLSLSRSWGLLFSVFRCLHLANDYELIFDCTISPFMHAYVAYDMNIIFFCFVLKFQLTIVPLPVFCLCMYDPQLWSWDMIVCCFFLVISTRAPAVVQRNEKQIYDLYTHVL